MLSLAWLLPIVLAGTDPTRPTRPETDPTRPTMVTLDFRNQPHPRVVEALSARSGNAIQYQFRSKPEEAILVTLEAPEPLPFWEALDRLCEDARLQSYTTGGSFGSGAEPLYVNGPWDTVEIGPATYVGPFRLDRFTMHRTHRQRYIPEEKRTYGVDLGDAYAEFQVLMEPRVIAVRTGPVMDLEAIDDEGRSLLDLSRLDEVDGERADRNIGRVRIPLALPEASGGRLVRLRGLMPVEVGIHPSEPTLSIPLDGATGQTFHAGDLEIDVRDASIAENGRLTLELRIHIDSARGEADHVPQNVLTERLMSIHSRQLEIVDAEGRTVKGFSGSGGPYEGALHLKYSTGPPYGSEGAGAPTHLNIHSPEWVDWDVPFEFTDLPLP